MAELALTVGLKGRDELSRPLNRAAKAARGLRGRARGAGEGLDRAAKGARAMAGAMAGPMAQAARKVRDLERASGETDRFRKLKTDAAANAAALTQAREKTQSLGRAMATGEGKTAKTAAAFKKARKDLAALEKKTQTSTRAVADQRAKLKAAGISTRDLASSQRGLKRDLDQARAAAEGQARALARAAARAERLARAKDRLRGFGNILGKAARAGGVLAGVGAIGGAATLAGLGRLVTGFAAATDEISKFARQTGFTAEGVQELQYAADRSGVSQETFNASIGAFSKRLGELRAGKGALAGLLKDADPALAAQLAGASSAEDAFASMMAALEKIEDPQRRAALAAAAFSRSGMVMTRMAEAGSDGLAALRKEARDLGAVVDNKTAAGAEGFVDTMTRFNTAMDGLGKTIATQLMPALQPVIESLTAWIAANRSLIAARVQDVIARISSAVRSIDFAGLRDSAVRVASAIGAAVDALGGWENAAIAAAAALSAGLIGSVLKLGGALIGLASGGLPLLITGFKALATTALPLLIAGFKALATTALPLLITGFKALTVAVMTNPIGLIVGGIALAAGLIVANWEPIAGWFSDLWRRIREPARATWNWIKRAFGWTPLGLVIKNWEPIAAWLSGLWDSILAPFRSTMAFIETKLGGLSGAVGKVRGFFGSLFGGGDDAAPSARGRSEPFPAPVAAGRVGPGHAADLALPFAAVSPPAASGRSSGSGRVVNQTINLTVTPPPGADPREVARLVMEALDRAGAGAGSSGRGRLMDGEE